MNLPLWWHPLADRVKGLTSADLSRHAVPPANGGRPSAVLVLLGETADGPDVLLLQRASSLAHHAGQAAFPGGGLDPEDDGPIDAALREATEEVGLHRSTVEVVAQLPELWLPVSDYRVTPVLGWWREPHPVRVVDVGEVERVVRVPIAELTDPANRLRVRHPSGYTGPAFAVRGLTVWGFTAGILSMLLDLAEWARPWDPNRVEPIDGA